MRAKAWIVVLLAAGAAGAAQESPPQTLGGEVLGVDGTVLSLGTGDRKLEVRVAVEDGAVVTLSGKPAKLADLQKGMRAVVQQENGITKKVEAFPGRGKK